MRWPKVGRDTALLLFGMLLIARESFRNGQPSTEILTAAVTLIMGPLALRADERRKGKTEDEAKDPT